MSHNPCFYESKKWTLRDASNRCTVKKKRIVIYSIRHGKIKDCNLLHIILFKNVYISKIFNWHSFKKVQKIINFYPQYFCVKKYLLYLCFLAPDPLIDRLKGLEPKNKGRTNFYEGCDLTKNL